MNASSAEDVVDPDPDGDTHLCLKCRQTVTGLDNYVQHRRTECQGLAAAVGKADRATETRSNDIKADDFFSLLELQSSTKTVAERAVGTGTSSSSSALRGMLTRSKSSGGRRQTVTQATQATRAPRGSSGPRPPRGIGRTRAARGTGTRGRRGVGRPRKRIGPTARKRIAAPTPEEAPAPMEEESVDRFSVDDTAFEEPDTLQPGDYTEYKWKPASPSSVSSDEDEESDLLTAPLRTSKAHGKIWRASAWSRTPSPSPPPSPLSPPQRGGKWVPEPPTWRTPMVNEDLSIKFEDMIEEAVEMEEVEEPIGKVEPTEETEPVPAIKDVEVTKQPKEPSPCKARELVEETKASEETESSQDSCADVVPSGGKWKPQLSLRDELRLKLIQDIMGQTVEDALPQATATSEGVGDEDADENVPPPGHTRGKWAPGMEEKARAGILGIATVRKSGSEVQYWCGVCNRRLSSSKMYERHLQSKMHKTRMLPETQLDMDPSSRDLVADEARIATMRRRVGGRQWEAERCSVCRARVRRGQIGKHLVSHYHWRYARMQRDQAGRLQGSAASMVLDNIKLVAYESSFRCTLCKFYCNTSAVLRQHWGSDSHRAEDMRVRSSPGQYWCTGCRVGCPTSAAMEVHLWSPAHKDVEEIINNSMPIVVLRYTPLRCQAPGCAAEFRFNRQLARHERRSGHGAGAGRLWPRTSTASDRYQRRLWCPECGALTRSRLSLQRHVLNKHSESGGFGPYFCGLCSMEFTSAREAAVHRLRAEHRDLQRGRSARRCPHCGEACEGLAALRLHLQEKHPDKRHRCSLCNKSFTLPQEVSRHHKEEHAAGAPPTEEDAKRMVDEMVLNVLSDNPPPPHSCCLCSFETDSKAELIFHSVLHFPPEPPQEQDGKVSWYRCPTCDKLFVKPALRTHLLLHTGERPFLCSVCNKGFGRKDTCVVHEVTAHRRPTGKPSALGNRDPQELGAEPLFDMGNKRNQLAHLEDNIQRPKPVRRRKSVKDLVNRERSFLCDTCGKGFYQKYTLQQHVLALHGVKPLACTEPDCVFRARSAAELRVHASTHKDALTEACNFCPFLAKTKRQINRHMKIHSGEKAYKCEFCDFATRISSHLARHRRVHTGAKPYRCPHCSYCCNNLENLRKHVLHTGKHPGKSMYECRFCPNDSQKFASNFATEFKTHLVVKHGDRFRSAASAASFVTGIYDKEADVREVTDPLPIPRRKPKKPKEGAVQIDSNARSRSVTSEEDLPTSILPRNSLDTLEGEFYSMVVSSEPSSNVIFIVEDDDFIVLQD